MKVRSWLTYNPETGTQGANGATAAPASTPAPAPGATPPPASAPAAPPAPPTASDEPPAWAKALIAKVDSIEGSKVKAEADKNAAEAKTKTAEERLTQIEEDSRKTKIQAALDRHLPRHQFADAKAEGQARKLFEAEHKLEAKDGGLVLAYGADGKPQHVDVALAAWLKTEGKHFLASAVQPGPGAPPSSMPQGAPQKLDVKNMPRDEFQKHLRDGTFNKLPLTRDARAPHVTFKNHEVEPLVARRNQMLGRSA